MQVLEQVRTLVVTAKSTSNPSNATDGKKSNSTMKHPQRLDPKKECSALLFDELFNIVCRFVSLSTSLHTLIFDQIYLFEGKHFRTFSIFLGKSKTGKILQKKCMFFVLTELSCDNDSCVLFTIVCT